MTIALGQRVGTLDTPSHDFGPGGALRSLLTRLSTSMGTREPFSSLASRTALKMSMIGIGYRFLALKMRRFNRRLFTLSRHASYVTTGLTACSTPSSRRVIGMARGA